VMSGHERKLSASRSMRAVRKWLPRIFTRHSTPPAPSSEGDLQQLATTPLGSDRPGESSRPRPPAIPADQLAVEAALAMGWLSGVWMTTTLGRIASKQHGCSFDGKLPKSSINVHKHSS